MIFDKIHLEVTSSDLAGRLRHINELGIPVSGVCQKDQLTASFTLRRSDYGAVEAYLRKKGDEVRLISAHGPGYLLLQVGKKPILTAAVICLFFLTLWIPTRVLFVKVEGNETTSSHEVRQCAEAAGVYFGARIKQVRSERVKNKLLSEIPRLQWVGVNTRGCVATIHVVEREEAQQEKEDQIASVVSSADALVTDLTVTRGNALCKPGDIVRQGQVLISGYTDCGIKIQAANAQGEVFGQTVYRRQLIFPSKYLQKGRTLKISRNLFLLIGKKEIKIFKDSGISGGVCDKMYASYYLTLPGGFQLPFGVAVETCVYRETAPVTIPQEEVQAYMERSAQLFLTACMISGQVLSSQQTIQAREDCYCLTGRYLCREMIGRIQYEKIGVYHEQNSGKDRKR